MPDTGWLPVAPGLEKRVVQIYEAGRAEPVEAAAVLRVDPAVYRFEVGYRPGQPQTLREWALESGGEIVINGGFFTPEWTATGLIIAGGEASGRSYGDFAGMVAIRDGRPEIRWLGAAPYDPAEPLEGALQAFPLLIRPGGVPGINADLERDTPDRRTAVAVDRSGRFLLIITPRGGLTLHAFSRFLAGADFDLEIALNLDGGTSSGLLWREGDQMTGIPAFTPLPAVLIAIRR